MIHNGRGITGPSATLHGNETALRNRRRPIISSGLVCIRLAVWTARWRRGWLGVPLTGASFIPWSLTEYQLSFHFAFQWTHRPISPLLCLHSEFVCQSNSSRQSSVSTYIIYFKEPRDVECYCQWETRNFITMIPLTSYLKYHLDNINREVKMEMMWRDEEGNQK